MLIRKIFAGASNNSDSLFYLFSLSRSKWRFAIKILSSFSETTIKTLYEKGYNKSQIASMLGVDRKTVRKVLKGFDDGKEVTCKKYPSMFDEYREYIEIQIKKELERDGIKTISGKTKWYDSVIRKMLRNEKYYGELLLQKTVTLDYLTKLRVVNNNHLEQYRVENNHEPIISKELWDLAQQECERRFAMYSGKNDDRSKYAKRYAFSGKLICGVCGTTYKRRHWNGKNSSAKIVWQCLNYVDKDAKTGKRCSSKRVDDKVLKETFIRVFNEEFRDKSGFFKAFLNNIQKVIEKNNDITPELDRKIAALEADLSGLITLKLHKDIDEKAYGRDYQRTNKEITDLQMKKSELVTENLEYTKDISKMQAVRGIIGDGSQPLTEFDDALFEAMVEKVIIKSTTEFEFIFESGQKVKAKASK